MKTIPRSFRRGNAILEAALVLPILISLTFGSIEFGHFFYVKHCLQGAARQGARAGIPADSTKGDVTAAVREAMAAYGLEKSGYSCTTAVDRTNVTVTVQCNWGKVGIRPLGLIGSDKLVRSVAVMRKE